MIISMLAVLESIASIGNLSVGEIGILVGVFVAFIGGALYLGSKTAPRLVDGMGKMNQYDLILITVLAVAFGLAFIADLILEYLWQLALSLLVCLWLNPRSRLLLR